MRGLAMVLILGACHNSNSKADATIGGGDGGNDADVLGDASVDANEGSGFRIAGVALGMREPTTIAVDVGADHRELIVTEDGAFRFPRRFPSGSAYAVSTTSARCRLTNATGALTGEVTNVGLYCIGVVELASITFTPSVITVSPGFVPDAFMYGGVRPFFADSPDLYAVTPIALYPAESTITYGSVVVPSGQTSTARPYGTGLNVQVTHAATGLSATYTFAPSQFLPRFESYIKASDPTMNARFAGAMVSGFQSVCGASSTDYGNGVALSGDTLVVGAPCAGGSGAAYVYTRTNTSWSFVKKLVASNPDSGDEFGAAVAIEGGTILVGAPFEAGNGNATPGSGAVYVFARGTNDWSDPPTLFRASTPASGARFGNAVAIDGTTFVAGQPFDANGGTAYVFTFNGTAWTQQASFRGNSTAASDQFAFSVSISGDRVACGAPRQDAPIDGGAAYVFLRNGTSWSQQAQVRANGLLAGDYFGWAVALDGNFLAVGAPNTNVGASDAGVAYAYEWTTAWAEAAQFKAVTPRQDDHLGTSVALARNAVAIGGFAEDGHATMIDGPENFGMPTDDVGAVLVYRRSGGVWGERHYIKAPNANNLDWFGASIAADGDTFAVGAYGEASGMVGNPMDNSALRAGAVYVFR